MHQKSTFTSQSQVIRLDCQLNFCRLIVVYSKRKAEANWCSPKRNCSLYRRPTLMKSSLLNIAQCLVGTGATTVTAVVPVIVAELPMTGRMKLYSHPPRPHLQLLHNHTPQTGRGVISDLWSLVTADIESHFRAGIVWTRKILLHAPVSSTGILRSVVAS